MMANKSCVLIAVSSPSTAHKENIAQPWIRRVCYYQKTAPFKKPGNPGLTPRGCRVTSPILLKSLTNPPQSLDTACYRGIRRNSLCPHHSAKGAAAPSQGSETLPRHPFCAGLLERLDRLGYRPAEHSTDFVSKCRILSSGRGLSCTKLVSCTRLVSCTPFTARGWPIAKCSHIIHTGTEPYAQIQIETQNFPP